MGGVVYAHSADATKALGSASLAGRPLAPGAPIEGEVAFDIPEAAIDGAQLIGRDLSGGTGEVTFHLGLSATAP